MIRWGDGQTFIQRIVEAVPSLIYVIDIRQRKIVFLNRDIGAALGDAGVRDPKDAEFIPSLLHPDDWHRFLDYLQRLADLRDETEKFEFRVRDSNGRWRWFRSRDRVFTRNEDGSVREIIGTATDSTESKSAEERAMFMADLNQAILPLADPGQITSAAVRMLGEYLAVDRCAYAEVEADEDHFVIMGNYTRGQMASIVGRYRMSDFGDRERKVLREKATATTTVLEVFRLCPLEQRWKFCGQDGRASEHTTQMVGSGDRPCNEGGEPLLGSS